MNLHWLLIRMVCVIPFKTTEIPCLRYPILKGPVGRNCISRAASNGVQQLELVGGAKTESCNPLLAAREMQFLFCSEVDEELFR
ncbi:hypothetical protein Y032_0227g2800 [Ancylostoma ceylanicum]|uniref:Secreted protein n=1 Tax=Ancylostoma ceylanicum TaxID=53326 RepID=A0A016SHF8_9BILA|nr:hypothetical protein Y032_0227g2800 [Ancylostoma ceylanicum]